MNYNEFLDNYIEYRKIRFLQDIQKKIQESKNPNTIDLKTEDLLFLLLIYLRDIKKGLKNKIWYKIRN